AAEADFLDRHAVTPHVALALAYEHAAGERRDATHRLSAAPGSEDEADADDDDDDDDDDDGGAAISARDLRASFRENNARGATLVLATTGRAAKRARA